ncbi:hypothetical protein D3C85_1848700 [compost metagenome]
MPVDRNSSQPTELTQAKARACSTPLAMLGEAAGSSTWRKRWVRFRPSTRLASWWRFSTWLKPSKVLSAMG